MSRPFVKICGLTNYEDAAFAAEAGADLLGFVMIEGAARNVTLRDFLSFRDRLPKSAKLVCVTQDRPLEELLELAAYFDVLQLHGSESPDFALLLKRAAGCEIIKALPLCDEEQLEAAREYPAEITLLAEGERQGQKRPCDWKLAARLAKERPLFLAGKLTALNVSEAAEAAAPMGVDVSGGVASALDPRIKEHKSITAFINAVRSIK